MGKGGKGRNRRKRYKANAEASVHEEEHEDEVEVHATDISHDNQTRDESVPVPIIRVETDEEILEGDPDHLGKMLYYKTLFDVSTSKAWEGALKNPLWTSFSYVPKNSIFSKSLGNDRLFIGINAVFGPLYSLNNFFSYLKTIQTPFTTDEREQIIEAAKLLGDYTYDEYKFFVLLQKSKNNDKEIEITLENLEHYIEELEAFSENKFKLLDQAKLLEDFQYEFHDQRTVKIETLRDKFYGVPQELIEEYVQITGVTFNDIIPTLKALEMLDDFLLTKKLEELGFSVFEFINFTKSFRDIAVLKSLELLNKNKELVNSEIDHYKNPIELTKLVSKIKSNADNFNDSDLLRAETLMLFIKNEVEVVANGVVLFKTALEKISPDLGALIEKRNNAEQLAEYIKKIRPETLITVLDQFLYLKNLVLNLQITPSKISATYTDPDYAGFKKADLMDLDTLKNIADHAKEFPVLTDASIDFRTLSRKKASEIKTEITEKILPEKITNNDELRATLIGNPEKVWELEAVIAIVKDDLGIIENTQADTLINDRVDDVGSKAMWQSIGLGALGIALGVAGFFTGGTTWAGAALIIGGIGVSGIDLYLTLEEYNFKSSASDTAFSDAEELSLEAPDLLGVALAVVGLVIDFGDIVKAAKNGLKGFSLGSKLEDGKIFKRLQELLKKLGKGENAEQVAGEIYDLIGKSRIRLSREEFIQRITELVGSTKKPDKDFVKFATDQFALIGKADGAAKLPRIIQLGLQDLYKADPDSVKFLIKTFGSEERILYKIAGDMLLDPSYVSAIKGIRQLPGMTETAMAKVFRYYGGSKPYAISHLLELTTEIAQRSKIIDPELLEQVLINKNLRKSLLGNPNDPGYFNNLWKDYKQGKGQGLTFEEYVLKIEKTRLNKIQKIGGAYPLNAEDFAGRTFSFDLEQNIIIKQRWEAKVASGKKSQAWMDSKIRQFNLLKEKYPNGVKFNDAGFPEFDNFVVKLPNGNDGRIQFKTTGDRDIDFSETDKLAGIKRKYREENDLVWHHHEDTETMLLVPTDIHEAISHSGGISVNKGSVGNMEE